ncbi:hypothetical protein Ahy_B01g056415 [Arachis hypogaea]|uniref:SWIM-type domain-containing protein n=1 Tax=Arachis hypogaea TaxID=3818 RepID=A0A445AYW0_ARAHY|nr:hypothetical protein Ahy_B01g056415 [Arachis hypogaea]
MHVITQFSICCQGLPCVHTVAAISKVRVKTAEEFVSPFLTIEAIRKTYDIRINPMNSEEFWEPTDLFKSEAPRIVRSASRPRMNRREAAQPPLPANRNKVRRTFQVTCNKCEKRDQPNANIPIAMDAPLSQGGTQVPSQNDSESYKPTPDEMKAN